MSSPTVCVNHISECFINPKHIPQEAKKPMHLSPWDLAMLSVNYIQKGLLFPKPENQDFTITTFLEELKDSLSTALTHFHPLAARLATRKQENPPSYVVFLNPNNSPGARFIHSTVDLMVVDTLEPPRVPLIVHSFFDHDKATNHDGHEISLLSVQVTELVDGIFIGVSINHTLVDGTSFWHFFNAWSNIFVYKQRNGQYPISISCPPVHERWKSKGTNPMINLPFTHHDQFIKRHITRPLKEIVFQLSSTSLSKLKAKANSECNTVKISALQAVSALLWRCITRARRIPDNQTTSCKMAVNNRTRLSPPLPGGYFGNSIHTVRAIATAGELLDHGVGWAAWRLHEAVVNHGDKAARGWAESWVKNPFVYQLDQTFDPNCVMMSSSPRFDMYSCEFGLGKALAVRCGYSNKFDGKVTSYPGREGGGSMDLEICLSPENMMAFEVDEELMSVVKDGEATWINLNL